MTDLYLRIVQFLFLALLLGQSDPNALPRRGFFGVGTEAGQGGPRVFNVIDQTAAARAGIQVGDVIVSIDDVRTETPADVIARMGAHRSGDNVAVDILRNGGTVHIEVELDVYPLEEMVNARVEYGTAVTREGVRLRTIITAPRSGAESGLPAVLLLQGGGCGSIDAPFSPTIGQPGLMHEIGEQGFVTMRVDKSGVGDSEGPPCEAIGYEEELDGYRAAMEALRLRPEVDVDRIYLLGYSLGGVFAPMLANEVSVAGISVYGTLDGPPMPYPGRSARFFEEFSAIDVSGAWATVDARVLILRGEFEDRARIGDQESIARIVNQATPGAAEYRELAGLDHCATYHASFEDSGGNCGGGEATDALSEAIVGFMRGR